MIILPTDLWMEVLIVFICINSFIFQIVCINQLISLIKLKAKKI